MKRALTTILSLSIAIASCPASGQEGFQGLLSDLDNLERQLQSPADPSTPLVQRLSNLELRLFGTPRSGSMVERLQSIKTAAREMPPPNPQPVFTGSGTGTSVYRSNINTGTGWAPGPNSGSNFSTGPAQALPPGLNSGSNFSTGPAQALPPGPNSGSNLSTGPAQALPPGLNSGSNLSTGPAQALPPGLNSGSNLSTGPAQAGNSHLNIAGSGWVPANAASGWSPGPANAGFRESNPQQRQAPNMALNAVPGNPGLPYNKMVSSPLPVQGAMLVRKNFAPDALPLLNAFPPNLVRMEPDNTALIARPDYYGEVYKASKSKVIRFKTMPIPVYVQPFPDKAFVNCVVRAFESWEMRTNGVVRFSQIDNPNQARIQVIWKHLGGNKDSSGCLLGAHTILKYTNRGNGSLSLMSVGAVPVPIYIPRMGPKYSVPPQVMEVNLDLIATKDPAAKYPCLQNIVTHELGHALGMLGHSPNQADIMYPVTDEHSRLSQRDINTVNKLYNEKCDVPL